VTRSYVSRTGLRRLYPWSHWFDGKTHLVASELHFDVEPAAFRRQVLGAARRRGLIVETEVLCGTVKIRCVGRIAT
jgi:hypothetical protein